MRIIDFDEKFFDYVRGWIALHPGISEDELESYYNEMMRSWLNAPASWLDGGKPGEYFLRYSDPKDLIKLLEEYDKRGMGLPEPLYSRIVEIGEPCVPALMRIASNSDRPESLRGTAMALLRDIGSPTAQPMLIDMVCRCEAQDEVCDMAVDALLSDDSFDGATLLDHYEDAPEYAQSLILEICVAFPGDERILTHLIEKLRTRPDSRALYASYLAELGDPRAIEALQPFLTSEDIGYLDYIEIRNAIEALGGDAGADRSFDGDPDYEALRDV